VALIAACGGVVVVDEGGSGGNTATSSGTTTFNTSSSTGTWTDTWTTDTWTTDTWTNTTTPTSTGTGPGMCDVIGECGENGGGCIDCAINGPCADPLNTCLATDACIAYSDCASSCSPGDQACLDSCEAQFPEGASLYNALIECVICWQCAASCAGQDWGCAP
jgi:hypothetical protein